MASIKTAISLHKNLFDQVNELAKEMHVSRSRLFVFAIEDFIKKNDNKKLLSKINAAYEDYPNEDEKSISKGMKEKHRQNIGNEAW